MKSTGVPGAWVYVAPFAGHTQCVLKNIPLVIWELLSRGGDGKEEVGGGRRISTRHDEVGVPK